MKNRLMRHSAGCTANLPACFLCAGLGAAVFLLVYGVRPLDVSYDAWILNGYIETDITQRYAGWLAYRAAPGFFPLSFSSLLSWPFGGYTALCDSIPLLEIVFKLLSPILPATFQFEGLTCLAALMLQGFCGALLVGLFTHDGVSTVLGGGLFCLSPILLERLFRHTSLSAQWMLLLALWLYFTLRRRHTRGGYLGFAALCIVSVGIHLYFTPMLLGLFAAAVLDEAVHPVPREKAAAHFTAKLAPFVLLLAAAAACVGFAAALGDLSIGGGNTSGYGTMGLNLNALFNPKSLGANWWVAGQGTIDWSLFLPMRALAENNIESFNYLGLGVLLGLSALAVFVLVRLVRSPKALGARLGAAVRRYPFLLCFAAFSTIFAVSNVVCAFSYVLVRLPLPAALLSLCSAFRASGRLFWSVNELLVLGCLVFVLRGVPAALSAARASRFSSVWVVRLALAALLLVQAVDLAPALAAKRADFAEASPWAGQLAGEELLQAMDGRTVLYNLELRDDRAMCAFLLKHGVASNYWLISRDAYGVPELQTDMAQTAAALRAGQDPYPGLCAYCTTDADTAEALRAAGWRLTQLDGLWLIVPAQA